MQLRILGIETSCDETAITILEANGDVGGATYRVLGNALLSQAHLHAEYGGVYPTLAKREHLRNLPILLDQTLAEAGVARGTGVDLIAVTRGPGLEPALWTGIEFAKKLGAEWQVPVVGIDHMEGHLVSALLEKLTADSFHLKACGLPLLALLISGGHTELVLMPRWHEYEYVGATRDDAVGEAFDKVARLLDLPYPGGPHLAALADKARKSEISSTASEIKFPRPMVHDNTCDFSFSGLKTAVLYKLRSMPRLTDNERAAIAAAFEDAATETIVIKSRRALRETHPATFVVGGGVSANTEIRRGLEVMLREEFPTVAVHYPDRALTGDNAIMIAAAAHLRAAAGLSDTDLTAQGARRLQQPPATH